MAFSLTERFIHDKKWNSSKMIPCRWLSWLHQLF